MNARERDNLVIETLTRRAAIPATRRSPKSAGKKAAPERQNYHHGSLREAMVDAAARLVEEKGAHAVTVREAARLAGVSPGAPFRHFPNKTALMTAVAEEAMRRFRAEIDAALDGLDEVPPLKKFRALGAAHLKWAMENAAHFEVVSARHQIDYDSSDTLREDNLFIQSLMERFLREAQKRGDLKKGKLQNFLLEARALSYGLARMYVDNHLPQWGIGKENAEAAMNAVLDHYLASLAATAPRGR
jgi:AcrR family transcriptional regulator